MQGSQAIRKKCFCWSLLIRLLEEILYENSSCTCIFVWVILLEKLIEIAAFSIPELFKTILICYLFHFSENTKQITFSIGLAAVLLEETKKIIISIMDDYKGFQIFYFRSEKIDCFISPSIALQALQLIEPWRQTCWILFYNFRTLWRLP